MPLQVECLEPQAAVRIGAELAGTITGDPAGLQPEHPIRPTGPGAEGGALPAGRWPGADESPLAAVTGVLGRLT